MPSSFQVNRKSICTGEGKRGWRMRMIQGERVRDLRKTLTTKKWREDGEIKNFYRTLKWVLRREMESKGVQERESRWGHHGFKLSCRDYAPSDGVNNIEGAGLIYTLSHCQSSVLSSAHALVQWVAEPREAWALRGRRLDSGDMYWR